LEEAAIVEGSEVLKDVHGLALGLVNKDLEKTAILDKW
jgi:hypothetical protein